MANVTVTISGGGLTSDITTITSSNGQYVVRVPGSTNAYTAKATLSGYQDWTKTDVIVAASTVVVVNIEMSKPIDYSIYSGDWTGTITTTNSSDGSQIGETFVSTMSLSVTKDGNATVSYTNTYCGTVIATGKFESNKLILSTNKDGHNCNGTICCTGQTTVTLTSSDKDNATGTGKSYSCCSSFWKEFSITLKRGILTDKDQIKANFAAAVNAYNNKDINTLISFFSLNYMDDGYDYSCNKADFERDFVDPNFKTISYTINSVTVSGDKATMSVTWWGRETENWIKENGIWRMYGNQQKYGVGISSHYWRNGYYSAIFVEDPNKNATSVTASGPGISGTMNFVYQPSDGFSPEMWGVNLFLGSSVPTTPQTYTITITDAEGTYTYNKTITGYVTEFATNLSPTGNVSGTITFSWIGISGADEYSVQLSDSSGKRIWNAYNLPNTTTSVTYTGPALTVGNTYHYDVVSEIVTGDEDNNSFAEASFTYTGAAKAKSNNSQDGLFLQTYETVKVTYHTVKQKIISTALSLWQRIIG